MAIGTDGGLMLCSVIIPLYNKERYIVAAVTSVLRQSWQEFEIIVVDDGSVDGGAELVRAMDDARLRVVVQANGGVSSARNRGIAEARGDIVTFLDADDWYLPDYLATMVDIARRFPTGAFYACSYQRVPDGQALSLPGQDLQQVQAVPDFYARWRRGAFFCTNSVAVRRSDLLALQPCFPLGESLGEDQDLWFRLAERLQLFFCPAVLVAYRIDVSDSLCATGRLTRVPNNYLRLEQRAADGLLPQRLRRSAARLVVDARVTVARALLLEGRRREAWSQLWAARGGTASRRWWLTLGMCLLSTPGLVHRWEVWRHRHLSR